MTLPPGSDLLLARDRASLLAHILAVRTAYAPDWLPAPGGAGHGLADVLAGHLELLQQRFAQVPTHRQAVMLAEVARRKDEAKKVLYFALTQCAAKYPVPYFFAIEDENGNLDIVRFTVGAYHAYLVAKHLEKPE